MSRSISLEFMFHNVGQGIFYTGILNYENRKLSFVYDCGSSTLNNSELSNRIKVFIKGLSKDTIDLLVVSHFHEDHINGLDILLNNKRVKIVVIPYMSFIERILIATVYGRRNTDNWYFEFILDPVTFLIERYKVHKVILIGQGKDGFSSDGENFIFPDGPQDFDPESPFDYNRLGDEEGNRNLYEQVLRENPEWKDSLEKENIIPKTHNGYGLLAGIWLFRFFNLRQSINNLNEKLNCFEECLKQVFQVRDLKNINKTTFINEIKKPRNNKFKSCYEKSFGKGNKLNLTSLSLLHMPILRAKYSIHLSYCDKLIGINPDINWLVFYIIIHKRKIIHNIHVPFDYVGQLLTGDLNLKYKKYFQEFKQHFEKFCEKTFIFQIPHHGSKGNWNGELLKLFENTPFWPICAGINNRYNHPSWSVIFDLVSNNKIPILINEIYSLNGIISAKY